MVKSTTYNYLTTELVKRLKVAYPKFESPTRVKGYGAFDKKPSAGKIAHLGTLLELSLYRCENPLTFTDGQGEVFVYNGKTYENVGDGITFFRELIKRTFLALNVGMIYVFEAPSRIAKSVMHGLESSDEFLFKPSYRYIAFTNGVLDLEKGELKGFNPNYIPKIVLDFPYVTARAHYKDCEDRYGFEHNPCRRWDRFIADKFEGVLPNEQIRKAFQSWCGMLLADREQLKVEYMACLYGPGSNGKSVLADVIKSVFGDQYCSNFTPKQLFKEGSSSEFRMNELAGSLLNVVGDLDKADFSGGEYKRFISGERVKARGVHERNFRFIKPPLMLCCTNEFPDTADDSHGHHRRLLPIASTTRIWTEKDKDPYLTAKLTTEDARVYVFSWIYEGYKRVIASNGTIEITGDVLEAQEYLKNRSNSLRRWWNDASDYCLPEEDSKFEWMRLKELHAEYVAYCEEHGEKEIFKDVDLGRMLVEIGFTEQSKLKRRYNGTWQYKIAKIEYNEDEDVNS